MTIERAIPYSATAKGRAAQIEADGGTHEHSWLTKGAAAGWRSVMWNLHTRICDGPRCFRLRLKAGTLREDVESEA